MKIPVELTGESRDLLMRHFKEGTVLHEVWKGASRKEFADVAVYSFECEAAEAETCWQWRVIIARLRSKTSITRYLRRRQANLVPPSAG